MSDDTPLTPSFRLAAVALDCADPLRLGEFYRDLLGLPIVASEDDIVSLRFGPIWLDMLRVGDYRPPIWPGAEVPKQFHLDVGVDDLAAGIARAVKLGATLPEHPSATEWWRVLLDPAGHPICLSARMKYPEP